MKNTLTPVELSGLYEKATRKKWTWESRDGNKWSIFDLWDMKLEPSAKMLDGEEVLINPMETCVGFIALDLQDKLKELKANKESKYRKKYTKASIADVKTMKEKFKLIDYIYDTRLTEKVAAEETKIRAALDRQEKEEELALLLDAKLETKQKEFAKLSLEEIDSRIKSLIK